MTAKRPERGSTLLETMVAGAVLIIGMVGILQLIISALSQFGITHARATGQQLTAAGLAQTMALPFTAVPLGVSDAGTFTDDDRRRYRRTMTVTDSGDGGVRARRVVVQTQWDEVVFGTVLTRTAQATVFISEVPDANF